MYICIYTHYIFIFISIVFLESQSLGRETTVWKGHGVIDGKCPTSRSTWLPVWKRVMVSRRTNKEIARCSLDGAGMRNRWNSNVYQCFWMYFNVFHEWKCNLNYCSIMYCIVVLKFAEGWHGMTFFEWTSCGDNMAQWFTGEENIWHHMKSYDKFATSGFSRIFSLHQPWIILFRPSSFGFPSQFWRSRQRPKLHRHGAPYLMRDDGLMQTIKGY